MAEDPLMVGAVDEAPVGDTPAETSRGAQSATSGSLGGGPAPSCELSRITEPVSDPTSSEEFGKAKRMPRHLLPTVQHTLPVTTLKEDEAIRNAFASNHHKMIKELPTYLQHNAVVEARAFVIARCKEPSAELSKAGGQILPSQKRTMSLVDDLFKSFEYLPDPYDDVTINRARERTRPDEAKMEAICGGKFKPFISTGLIGRRLKHEALTRPESDYSFPYLGGDLSVLEESEILDADVSKVRVYGGAFVPSGRLQHESIGFNGTSSIEPSLANLGEISNMLRKILEDDWGDTCFDIVLDTHGRIVARFKTETVESVEGLHTFMNILVKHNPLMTKHRLIKVPEHWCVEKEPGLIDFAIKPPWLPVRPQGEAFLKTHPERVRLTVADKIQQGIPLKPPKVVENFDFEPFSAEDLAILYGATLEEGEEGEEGVEGEEGEEKGEEEEQTEEAAEAPPNS